MGEEDDIHAAEEEEEEEEEDSEEEEEEEDEMWDQPDVAVAFLQGLHEAHGEQLSTIATTRQVGKWDNVVSDIVERGIKRPSESTSCAIRVREELGKITE